MTKQLSRYEKIQFVKDLMKGKASLNDISGNGSGGVLFIDQSGVFMYQSQAEGNKSFDPSITREEFDKSNCRVSHVIEFKNYSNPLLNTEKNREQL